MRLIQFMTGFWASFFFGFFMADIWTGTWCGGDTQMLVLPLMATGGSLLLYIVWGILENRGRTHGAETNP